LPASKPSGAIIGFAFVRTSAETCGETEFIGPLLLVVTEVFPNDPGPDEFVLPKRTGGALCDAKTIAALDTHFPVDNGGFVIQTDRIHRAGKNALTAPDTCFLIDNHRYSFIRDGSPALGSHSF